MTATNDTTSHDPIDPEQALNTVRELGFDLLPCVLDSEAMILVSHMHANVDQCTLNLWLPIIAESVIPYFAQQHRAPHNPREQMAIFLRRLRSVRAFAMAASARRVFRTAAISAQNKYEFTQRSSAAHWGVEAVILWMEES